MEFLLCAADTMMAWAQASEPLKKASVLRGGESDGETFELPVLPVESRFVPRDIATYYLSQLPKLDVHPISTGERCAKLVAQDWETNIPAAFGRADLVGPYTEPEWDYSGEETQRIADASAAPVLLGEALSDARTAARLHILRAGARLLEKAGRLTIASDRGVAERSMGRAADPQSGAERYWGAAVRPGGEAELEADRRQGEVDPYNSMAHLYSYFYGRWERNGEPGQCPAGTVDPTSILAARLPALGARIVAYPPRTAGARRAMQLLQEANVVVIDEGVSKRDALAELLPEVRGSGADTVAASLAEVTDADLELAYAYRSRHADIAGFDYALLDALPIAGGSANAYRPRAGSLSSDAANSSIAEVGSLQLASLRPIDITTPTVDGIFPNVAQSYATIALSFARRSREVGRWGNDRANLLADASTTEILQWGGAGWVDTDFYTATELRHLDLTLHGLEKDIGTGTPVLVKGTAMEAECVAGTRSVCPEAGAISVLEPTSVSVTEDVDGAESGLPGTVRKLAFVDPGEMFNPSDRGSPYPDAKHLYLVKPGNAQKVGTVFTAIGFGDFGGEFHATTIHPVPRLVSSMTEATLGVPELNKCAQSGDCTIQKSAGYCLSDRAGVPYSRDLFVPLENELTGDGDQLENSWKQYLSRAKESAERADALGKEALKLGETIGLRREGAQEKLAEYCGVHGLPGEAKFVNHRLELGPADPVLEACLEADFYGRTYLGSCPEAEENCACSAQSGEDCYRGLELMKAAPSPSESPDGCAGVAAAVAKIHQMGDSPTQAWPSTYSSFSAAINEPASIRNRIGALEFHDRGLGDTPPDDGPYSWTLSFQGAPLMDSTPGGTLWPGCMSGTCPPSATEDVYNDMFGVTSGTSTGTIRWLVLGAMSQLTRMSGYLPGGMFNLYIPQVTNASATNVSMFNMYPQVEGGGSTDFANISARALASGTPPSSQFPAVGHYLPPWLAGVQGSANYALIRASNVEIPVSDKFEKIDLVALVASAAQDPLAMPTPEELDVRHSGSPSIKRDGGSNGRRAWIPACVRSWVEGAVDAPSAGSEVGFFVEHSDEYALVDRPSQTMAETLPLFAGSAAEASRGHWYQKRLSSVDEATPCLARTAGGDIQGSMDCVVDGTVYAEESTGLERPERISFPKRYLRPSVCSPDARVPLYANPIFLGNNRDYARRVGAAVALNCRLYPDGSAIVQASLPPKVSNTREISSLRVWVNGEAQRIEAAVAALYLEGVPVGVLQQVKAGKLSQVSKNLGSVGRAKIDIANSLISFVSAWKSIANLMRGVGGDIDIAELTISKIDAQKQGAIASAALAQINIQRREIAAMGAFIGSLGVGSFLSGQTAGAILNLAGETDAAIKERGHNNAAFDAQKDALAAEAKLALNTLNTSVGQKMSDMQQLLLQIQKDSGTLAASISSLRQLQLGAAQQIAIALGESYYVDANGRRVDVPINSVLDRQYDVARVRYEDATEQAKYLSYLARRAIEQRLLVKLGNLDKSVGPIDAPSKWADDLCSMRGIRYDDYSLGENPDGSSALDPNAEDGLKDGDPDYVYRNRKTLASEYIGDYVQKLETFVNHYNVAFPAHEGDDQAVISLRNDAVPPGEACFQEARNLLLYSGDLTGSDAAREEEDAGYRGWFGSSCQEGRCLQVQSAASLPDASVPGFPGGETSWLHLAELPLASAIPSGAPAGSVWQEVEVEPGPHVLSFWAQSRGPDGGIAGAPDSEVYVGLYDALWKPIAPIEKRTAAPAAAAGPESFGERQVVGFMAPAHERIHVALSVARADGGLASAVIGNVQLERAANAAGAPTGYQSTRSSRTVFAGACSARTASSFQGSFVKTCEGSVCTYDRVQPIVVDTRVAQGTSGIERRLASGSFNYRAVSVALNLVGTGVLDCSREGPDCYANSTVEYSLEHAAYDLPLGGWDGAEHRFNFGTAWINHGKVLTAERVIGTPVGASDQSLISQLGIEKVEFRGRPVDGSYRLRIWDRPALVWSRVEDIQVVLKYRYWSRIDAAAGGN